MVRKTDLSKGPAAPATSPRKTSDKATVAAFLAQARAHTPPRSDTARGRLIFALDATMSRQPTWDLACELQSSMFGATDHVGGLSVQLAYFRGHAEARASRWVEDGAALRKLMTGIACHGGLTQIGRILEHAERAAAKAPVAALVYVGDALEEDIDRLCHQAGQLALRNTRAFMFLEGRDPTAERGFREIARLTGGVFLPFDTRASSKLRDLLAAVATYAAGGRAALTANGGEAARTLLADLRA